MPSIVRVGVCGAVLALIGMARCDAFTNMHQTCKAFKCATTAMTPAPKTEVAATANGCGTQAATLFKGTDKFAECCSQHEACYSICGLKKATCDKRFDKCMRAQCKAIEDDDSALDECRSSAKVLSITAQAMGCSAHRKAQRAACQCVGMAAAATANRARLMHILEAGGADKQDRTDQAVDALLKKYAGQEPTMFLRLLKKYPSAVQTDKTQTCLMDGILRDVSTDSQQKSDSSGASTSTSRKDTLSVGLDEVDQADDDDLAAPVQDEPALEPRDSETLELHLEL